MSFASRYGPWAVVAGASESGASVARLLGARGVNVVLVSRRQSALDEVAATVRSETRTVVVDLSSLDAVTHLAEATADLEVGLLVYYAAGDAPVAPFFDMPVEVEQGLVTLNCQTVVGAVHHFGGLMVSRGRGGIVLVGSNGAWAGGPRIAVYMASKAFDLILAESLWAELRPRGVDVLAMVMSGTDTPGFRRNLKGRVVEGLADPDDVARDMLDHLADGPTFPPDPAPLGTLPRRQAVELRIQQLEYMPK